MPTYICVTCGVEHAPGEAAPEGCKICQDERQYVKPGGQKWTTLDELQSGHSNRIELEEPGLVGIGTEPKFAIGQRALLVQAPGGNILWDCISLIDRATVQAVRDLGGIATIAISHPHFYSSMVEWSRAFGDVPIHLHASNREWVMRPDPAIRFWEGETFSLGEGISLVRCGGHFPGSTVLHWAAAADGRGVLLTGDSIYFVPDRRYVSFMYSYPNLIPLAPPAVSHLARSIEPLAFDRMYAGWFGSVVPEDAKSAVQRSATRYIRAIGGTA
jgi:hypothetical protein